MSLITVDYRSRIPIYEQLVTNIQGLVVRGLMEPDEPLPSVRQLAAELAINPNTIQKAYAELERQGTIYSLKGRGSFICADKSKLMDEKKAKAVNDLLAVLREAYTLGMTRDEMIALIDRAREESDQ